MLDQEAAMETIGSRGIALNLVERASGKAYAIDKHL